MMGKPITKEEIVNALYSVTDVTERFFQFSRPSITVYLTNGQERTEWK